jgi:NAD(P)-dependent dehydrogenase (short-subunit alcohol dehydrogenase family)
MMLLKDKVAIVTGGAKGMGAGICQKFAAEGARVVTCDLDYDGCKNVVAEIEAMGGKALAFKTDITKSADIKAMIDGTLAEFGTIDILINCAGGVPGTHASGATGTFDEAEWNRIININLTGPWLVTDAVLPTMKKNQSGAVVFVSSMGAVSPVVSVLHYHAAKAGVIGLALNLAYELAPQNIRVNTIVPGPIQTTFWDSLLPAGPERDTFFAALSTHEVPLKRMGTAEDIAGAALFLASDLSAFVTGQTLCVAGGQPMQSHNTVFNIENYLKSRGLL